MARAVPTCARAPEGRRRDRADDLRSGARRIGTGDVGRAELDAGRVGQIGAGESEGERAGGRAACNLAGGGGGIPAVHLVDVGPVGADHAVGRGQVGAGACDRVVLADGGEGAARCEFRGGSADGIGLDGD